MTACPDWGLAALPDGFLLEDSAARAELLEHAEDCPSCQRKALGLDPALAVVGMSAPEFSVSEIESLQEQVMALRRVRRVEGSAMGRAGSAGSWHRVAAAALVAAVAFLVPGTTQDLTQTDVPYWQVATDPETAMGRDLFNQEFLLGSRPLPLVESLSPTQPRIYQLGQDDFSLVMMVDESFDL